MRTEHCDLCEAEVKDEILILQGWLDEAMLCKECQEDADAWIEAMDAGCGETTESDDEDDDGDVVELGDMGDGLPFPSIMAIRNIAEMIIESNDRLDEITMEKYGLRDYPEMWSLVVEEVSIQMYLDGGM
jgi:hypothetical protein